MYEQNTLRILGWDVSQTPLPFHRPPTFLPGPERMFEATNTLENSHLETLTETPLEKAIPETLSKETNPPYVPPTMCVATWTTILYPRSYYYYYY